MYVFFSQIGRFLFRRIMKSMNKLSQNKNRFPKPVFIIPDYSHITTVPPNTPATPYPPAPAKAPRRACARFG